MDKEIDIQLFVTCRLCIEEVGQYQIVPTVSEQFKYCFGISVDPFDGLPQLVCQKCKDVLNNFFNLKKLYCEKQTDLMRKYKRGLTAECIPQHDIVSSSQRTEKEENKSKFAHKTIRTCSRETDDSMNSKKKRKKTTTVNYTTKWDYTGFKKEIVCSVCNSLWPNKGSFIKHQALHSNYLEKHPWIFKKIVSVKLVKVDCKPNITGMHNTVVHNKNKIIENCNSLYYVKYSKEANQELDCNGTQSVVIDASSLKRSIETTDTDEEIIRRPQHVKRRRVTSKSSNETVVVESNRGMSDNEEIRITHSYIKDQRPQVANVQCINIADSSDSDADGSQIESSCTANQSQETKRDNNKIIQGIISMCVKSYNNRIESTEKSDKHDNTESQLKHKVLSLGRKIINRSVFNWTGLLRYMEYKNLNITWAPKAISTNNSKDCDYIRILTKLRGTDTSVDNCGWTPIVESSEVSRSEPDQDEDVNQVNTITDNTVNSVQPCPEPASLILCNSDQKSKLLNANPVANPKQLPRKLVQTTDLRFNVPIVESGPSFHNTEDANICMPIITSTTSLAVPNVIEQHKNDQTGSVATTSGLVPPRIQVRPVSELMSERTLNNLRQESSNSGSLRNMLHNGNTTKMMQSHFEQTGNKLKIQNNNSMSWSTQGASNVLLPNIVNNSSVAEPRQMTPFTSQAPKHKQLGTPRSTTQIHTKAKVEYGIMNSVQLPNTKTNSPVVYLKSLFQLHNLHLIEPQEALRAPFLCLLKFKVKFQQEPIDEPVTLCLSLYCYRNTFYFTVKDRNEVRVDINLISANWQWEIINVFRGDIVEKLRQNAQKHNRETYDYTNKFISLLKSVTFKKLP